MYNKKYTRDDTVALAKALEATIMTCMFNAHNDPARETYWINHAAKLEGKFTTDFGKHYSYFLYA